VVGSCYRIGGGFQGIISGHQLFQRFVQSAGSGEGFAHEMGRTLQIETPRAFLPLLAPARYKGAYGGRGSGKSHYFAELFIERCVMQRTRGVCIREVQRSLEQSVKRLLEDKIRAFGVGSQFVVMDAIIKTPHGGIIIFNGMQNHTAESIKSLEGYDVAWVEEAQSLSDRSLTMLRPTLRKEDSELWFSWNPRHPTDPVDKLLRSDTLPPSAVVVRTNWKDNPWFPEVLRQEMEWDRNIDLEKYAHVWDGEYEHHSEARVFKNWRIEEFETPSDAYFYLGADWGFSVDPSTLVRCFEKRIDLTTNAPYPRKRLYIDRDIFRVGIEIDYLPAYFDGLICGCEPPDPKQPQRPQPPCREPKMHGWARHWPIIADSARPETISYMQRAGFNMEKARKGANSVREGVMFLQGYDIIIHPRCVHTIDEFTNYAYVRDRMTDQITGVLADKKNHIIDPIRYAVEQLRGVLVIREALWG